MWTNKAFSYTTVGGEHEIVPTFDTVHADLLIVAKAAPPDMLMNLSNDGGVTFGHAQAQLPNASYVTIQIDDYADVYAEPMMLPAAVVASNQAPASGNVGGSLATSGQIQFVPFASGGINALRLLASGSGIFPAGTVIEIWLR